jgi:hypothetical protein
MTTLAPAAIVIARDNVRAVVRQEMILVSLDGHSSKLAIRFEGLLDQFLVELEGNVQQLMLRFVSPFPL